MICAAPASKAFRSEGGEPTFAARGTNDKYVLIVTEN